MYAWTLYWRLVYELSELRRGFARKLSEGLGRDRAGEVEEVICQEETKIGVLWHFTSGA